MLPTAVVKITKEKKKTNNKIKPQQKHQQPNKQENKPKYLSSLKKKKIHEIIFNGYAN